MRKPDITKECQHHGLTAFAHNNHNTYRCKICRSEAVARVRRKTKQTLVNIFGGKCVICGYNKFVGALDFHHINLVISCSV
jgi:hypothetical protein